MPPIVYFDAEFAGVPILVSRIETTGGRDITVQSPARGSRHTLKDRGMRHRVATCEILFVDQPGQPSYLERFDQLHALANADDGVRVFSHPLVGSYRARFGEFTSAAEAGALQVQVSATLLAEDEPQQVFPAGAGVSIAAGLESVSVASSAAITSLADLGMSSPVLSAVLLGVQGWADATSLDSQQVFLEAESLTRQLNSMIDELELATDLDNWGAYRSINLLRYQLARAAAAFTSDSERLIEITVQSPAPLLAICAEIYGAVLAVDRAAQIQKLNRIRTPGRIAGGTKLKIIATGAS